MDEPEGGWRVINQSDHLQLQFSFSTTHGEWSSSTGLSVVRTNFGLDGAVGRYRRLGSLHHDSIVLEFDEEEVDPQVSVACQPHRYDSTPSLLLHMSNTNNLTLGLLWRHDF